MKRVPALALALCLAACRTVGRDTYDRTKVDLTPADGGTFVEASIGDATFLNPILSTDSASNDINNLLYNGLVKYNENIELVGDLAESWTLSNGGKTITFKLRENVKWHDGRPFTSDDVMFTYRTLISSNTRTAFSADYLPIEKAEAPDRYTFRVTYPIPFSPAIESWGIGMIPKHIWENGDINEHPANRNPVGTGPYIFSEWVPDEKIVLVANPNYFKGRPHIDRYVYRIIPDMAVQFLELRQGSLSMHVPTPDQYNGYDEFFTEYDKYHYPAFRYDYIGFNLENPLFKDKRVRLAIALAIDRQAIIDGVYQGLAVKATGPFPAASWAYNPNVLPLPYDPARAKALLAEAGWKDSNGDGVLDKNGKPFSFTLVTNQGNKVRETTAVVVQSALRQIGIQMDVRIMEWSVFIHKYVDEKQFEAILLAWSLARDPDAFAIWHSSQREKNQYNHVGYVNPEVDRLLEQGRVVFGVENRRPIYHKVHQLIADDVPYVFLVVPESLPVVHKKIINVKQAPAGLGWNFEEWFIPKEWQGKTAHAS